MSAGLPRGVLAGRRIVLTRPRTSTDDLAQALEASGADVVLAHAVEICGPEDGGLALRSALERLRAGEYSWVVLTSANAVDRLLEQSDRADALGPVRLAAVGAHTAGALARHGLAVKLTPARQSAEGLAAELPAADVPGARVLYPCAQGARTELIQGLEAKGWSVDRVVAYRTVAGAPPDSSTLAAIADSSAVVFASPSSVRSYLAWRTGDPPSAVPVPPVVACIGPVTAEAARGAGVQVTVVAPSPSPEALVACLTSALAGVSGLRATRTS